MDHQRRNEESPSGGVVISASQPQSAVIRPYGGAESECGYCKGARSALVNKPASASSKSYSILAEWMTPAVYEDFLHRGWRRSGIHLYKPANFESCCPTLTIRLKTRDFQMTKSQSKIMKRMNKLLVTSPEKKSVDLSQATKLPGRAENFSSSLQKSLEGTVEGSGILNALEEATKSALHKCLATQSASGGDRDGSSIQSQWKTQYRLLKPSKRDLKRSQVQAVSLACAQVSGRLSTVTREELVENVVQTLQNAFPNDSSTNNGVCILAVEAHRASGQIRCTLQVPHQQLETGRQLTGSPLKYDNDDIVMTDLGNDDGVEDKTEDKLGCWYQKTTGKQLEPKHRKITIETLAAHESALNPDVHRLYTRYQHVVHNESDPFIAPAATNGNAVDDARTCTDDDSANGAVGEEDEDGWITADSNQSKLDWGNTPPYFNGRIQSFLSMYLETAPTASRDSVLANYYSFYQFLVEAPFPFQQSNATSGTHQQRQPSKPMDATKEFGLYHQHYRLGELLIAVGVVDILPSGLSSVYLFYDPSFSHELVALGKYAILKEVEFTRDTLQLPYYYLGYYIESCQKMRYKAEYKPSQLLCPKYYVWVDADEGIAKLQSTPLHVCALATFADDEEEAQDLDNGNGRHGQKNNKRKIVDDKNWALHHVQMDIGAGVNVTIDMLQPSGVNIVTPILEEFIEEAGPELSVRCLVKLS